MSDLYFFPMACSLAARIAAYEAGVELRYRRVDLFGDKQLIDELEPSATQEKRNLRDLSAMGQVPVLVTDQGNVLTENAAVLQYIADLNPDAHLAPPPGDTARYRLQQWLSFVGTEVHKGFNNPTFMPDTPQPVKVWARERLDLRLSVIDKHFQAGGPYLLGDAFTVADAYLVWALMLVRVAGVDLVQWSSLAAYLERARQRPSVKAAVALERKMVAAPM